MNASRCPAVKENGGGAVEGGRESGERARGKGKGSLAYSFLGGALGGKEEVGFE